MEALHPLMARCLSGASDLFSSRGMKVQAMGARQGLNGHFQIAWVIPSDPTFLPIVRATLEQLCTVLGWSESEAKLITLALEEALTNVIRHAYCNRADGVIELLCEKSDGKLQFVLSDSGTAPDPARICARQDDSTEAGGMGTHIIRGVMDTVDYQSIPSGNRLVMTKRIRQIP